MQPIRGIDTLADEWASPQAKARDPRRKVHAPAGRIAALRAGGAVWLR